ncbi:Asp-tRNA(Asn)/Glu-tRNA(Gln) amidotransferase subunit GatA [Alkalicella caledoniensis]|nr:Asp-tRNA(Asn)/Glu-tRNA(Gln) amidotransferase subunit GatA [Alkalicella caledoniensis]
MYIKKLNKLLTEKEISCKELTEIYIEKLEALDKSISAFITITKDEALKKANETDEKIAQGQAIGLLDGIPMTLKDNISTKGILTTAASKMLENYIPPYSATVFNKLSKSVLLGKVNLDEFAMGTSTETSYFYNTKNPWDLNRVPGGSSGGSVASIAADLAVFSLGSDTGGSIRQPAAFCGVVGMKPTYGLVSRYGVFSLASSLDQVGPVTKTVEDSAHVLSAILGHDSLDSTSSNIDKLDYNMALLQDLKGMRIGIAKEFLPKEINPTVKKAFNKSVELLESLGAKIIEISLPHMDLGLTVYSIIAYCEAASNLARYDGVRFGMSLDESLDTVTEARAKGFGQEVKRRIMLGTFFLQGGNYKKYYEQAKSVQGLIISDFQRAFAQCDCILSPTTLDTAFESGKEIEPHLMALNDLLTIPVNLAGLPAMSIPCGFDSNGLPIGLQIIANKYEEGKMFTTGHNYQIHTDFHLQKPKIVEGGIIDGF